MENKIRLKLKQTQEDKRNNRIVDKNKDKMEIKLKQIRRGYERKHRIDRDE